MSINQKSERQTFRRRFVSGSLFVSPRLPECNFQSETKIEPDLRLNRTKTYSSLNDGPEMTGQNKPQFPETVVYYSYQE